MRHWLAALFLASFFFSGVLTAQDVDALEREAQNLRAEIARLKTIERQGAGEGAGISVRLKNHIFQWTTQDRAFSFGLKTVAQARFTYHDVRGNSGRGGDNGADFANFRIPHMRFSMDGNIFAKEFQYKAQWRPFIDGQGVRIDDLWFCWAPTMLFNVTVGQMRVPATWETLVDPENWSIMDRSAADQAFHHDWGKGILFSSALDLWGLRVLQFNLGFFNGVADDLRQAGMLNTSSGRSTGVSVTDADAATNFRGGFRNRDGAIIGQSFSRSVDTDLMPAARVEFHPMGEMPRHGADARRTFRIEEWWMMVGVGVNWFAARFTGGGGTNGRTFLGNSIRLRDIGTDGVLLGPAGSGRARYGFDALNVTLDGHFRWMGMGVNWALQWRRVKFHSFGAAQNGKGRGRYLPAGVEDTGLTVEANYYALPRQLLFAFRVSAVNFDEFGSTDSTGNPVDGDSFGPDSVEYTGSVCYEFHGDHLKLGLDYRYLVQQMPHGVGKGKLSLSGIERVSDYRNLWEIRLQLQWIF